jgi:phosphate transport system protein
MTKSLDDDLDLLKQRILRMGGLVEQAVRNAIAALAQGREELAREVLQADDAIDMIELDVDEECLRILALHQPVAGDLRFITAALKINNDLERIGDLAANVAERALDLCGRPPLAVPLQFERMAEIVQEMLRGVLDALVTRDGEKARQIVLRDQDVNAIHREHFAALQEAMKASPDNVERAVDLLSVSRQLERIGDQTTNIAEDVVFMTEALVIRHHGLGKRPPGA